MDTVRKLLDDKGTTIWSIAPDESVYDAVKLMTLQDLGALAAVFAPLAAITAAWGTRRQ